MAVILLLVAIIGSALARSSDDNVIPVDVTLYYETLCPDCKQFIPQQLFSTYTDSRFDFASLISKLTLVPYGWVVVNNATTHDYECQHGRSECDGNRLHSCAINYVKDELTLLSYITCLENQALTFYKKGGYFKYPINKCKNKLPAGLYPKIIKCYNSEEGWELFEKNGEKTNSFFPSGGFVPYVSFNNIKDDNMAQEADNNFRKALCKVTGVVDKACSL